MSVLDVSATRFKPKTGMTDDARGAVAEKLGVVLANSYMLFIKTQGVHWNVTGAAFYSVHKLTEEHYENLFDAIDDIAERIRALGAPAPASYTKYGQLAEITDDEEHGSVDAMVAALIADHETVVRSMREAIEPCEEHGDYVTADMLIARMTWHEEAIWMLRALRASD